MLTARRLSHAPARALQAVALYSLRDRLQLQRFSSVSRHYTELCDQLDPRGENDRYALEDGYNWKRNVREIRASFKSGVPIGFLSQPTISATMVFRSNPRETRKRIDDIMFVWPEEKAANVLREDYIGLPHIVDTRYVTSSNRVHHASHLTSYEATVGRTLDSWHTILEWGGGYGDMARLIRRLNRKCTYAIVDLPELCALQYIYLFSLLGEEVNWMIPGRGTLIDGRINIIPVSSVLREEIKISAQAFISTWGLTESSKEAQTFVCERSLFGAESVLLAYSPDRHNAIRSWLLESGCVFKPIQALDNKHEYAFM